MPAVKRRLKKAASFWSISPSRLSWLACVTSSPPRPLAAHLLNVSFSPAQLMGSMGLLPLSLTSTADRGGMRVNDRWRIVTLLQGRSNCLLSLVLAKVTFKHPSTQAHSFTCDGEDAFDIRDSCVCVLGWFPWLLFSLAGCHVHSIIFSVFHLPLQLACRGADRTKLQGGE